MWTFFSQLLQDRCPHCKEKLSREQNSLLVLKFCTQGHYKEETYTSLGVRVVYDSISEQRIIYETPSNQEHNNA